MELGVFCTHLHYVCKSCLRLHLHCNAQAVQGPKGLLCLSSAGCQGIIEAEEMCESIFVQAIKQICINKHLEANRIAEARQASRTAVEKLVRLVHEALMLECPNCQTAWSVEFDDCWALQCSECKMQTCAYCFDFGKEMHDHVPRCPKMKQWVEYLDPFLEEHALWPQNCPNLDPTMLWEFVRTKHLQRQVQDVFDEMDPTLRTAVFEATSLDLGALSVAPTMEKEKRKSEFIDLRDD